MEWKLLATTFGAIFLAELGDKTQLATMTLAATRSSKWSVFVGAARHLHELARDLPLAGLGQTQTGGVAVGLRVLAEVLEARVAVARALCPLRINLVQVTEHGLD